MDGNGLDRIFKPNSIAVIGGSDKPGSVGGAILSNLRRYGFEGPVAAVNSKGSTLFGDRVYSSIAELPHPPELAIICTPATSVPSLIRECGERAINGVVVISAGFREAGAAGRENERALQSALRDFPRLRMIGPNCLGVIHPCRRLNASFSPVMPSPGRLTFLSQSGALCTAILDWSVEREIGFATCVSVGNMANVGFGDLIDYFADDDQTDAILLYIEGVDDAAHFLSAARSCTRRKPIIAYKAGRFLESSHAATSHTGAIASADAVYEAAFRRAGIERANSIEELFDCARLLVRPMHPQGDRLAIVTNAGGPGVMATDAWLATGGHLASLTSDTVAALNRHLPPCWSQGNPVDVLGDASAERFESAIDLTLKDPNVEALLVIVTPQTMTQPTQIAQVVATAQSRTSKPIVASWIGGGSVREGRSVLKRAAIPAYDFPEEAVNALKHLVSTGRMKATSEFPASANQFCSPSDSIFSPTISSNRLSHWRNVLATTSGLVDESQAKELLADYGIPVATSQIARSEGEAIELADRIGYPVVLKILSPDVSHKTDVGGVVLNIPTPEAVRVQYRSVIQAVTSRVPDITITGVSVQKMISAVRGVELLLGMTRDPQFGPVFLIGAGGVTAELQRDTALELPPFDRDVIEQMLRSLRLYPLLKGYRGRSGVDLEQLRQVMSRFVQLVEDLPQLLSAEINPLLASADNVIALDARMNVDLQPSRASL